MGDLRLISILSVTQSSPDRFRVEYENKFSNPIQRANGTRTTGYGGELSLSRFIDELKKNPSATVTVTQEVYNLCDAALRGCYNSPTLLEFAKIVRERISKNF